MSVLSGQSLWSSSDGGRSHCNLHDISTAFVILSAVSTGSSCSRRRQLAAQKVGVTNGVKAQVHAGGRGKRWCEVVDSDGIAHSPKTLVGKIC